MYFQVQKSLKLLARLPSSRRATVRLETVLFSVLGHCSERVSCPKSCLADAKWWSWPCSLALYGPFFFVRTDKARALILPVISSGIGRGSEAVQQPADNAELCSNTESTPRKRYGSQRAPSLRLVGRLKGSPLQSCRPSRIVVSAKTVRTPLSSPLIRWCEVSKMRSGAYPRSRSAIETARILIRKLQRYMYLWRTVSSHLEPRSHSICSALPHCRNLVQNGFYIYRRRGPSAHDAKTDT